MSREFARRESAVQAGFSAPPILGILTSGLDLRVQRRSARRSSTQHLGTQSADGLDASLRRADHIQPVDGPNSGR